MNARERWFRQAPAWLANRIGLRKHFRVLHWRDYGANEKDHRTVAELEEADIYDSRHVHDGDHRHLLMFDIDMEAALYPSSTPGRFHLIINREVPWKQYLKLLKVLRDVGVIEPAFYEISAKRGGTQLRLPWIQKGTEEDDRLAGGRLTDLQEEWLVSQPIKTPLF